MKTEAKRFMWLWLAVLLVLALVMWFGIRANPADLDAPGEPIARVTYYLLPDGSVTTVIENIGDWPLTLTPDGYLVPEVEGDDV
ncbi:MAG: hypothetical protein IJ960_06810 [Oscillospiraceae bacterium]|nr:hypothetical protein [Oscillospiraceae bacterium]